MKKIRVLEMIDQAFLGGGQRHVLSLVKSLSPEKFQVAVGSEAGGPLVEELKNWGIRHYSLQMGKSSFLRNRNEILSLLKKAQFDILHTHGGVAGLFGRLAACQSRIPVVVHTLHGIHYLHYRNPFLRKIFVLMERWLSRRTDAVIFVSQDDRIKGSRLKLVPEEKIIFIPNGIDFQKYSLDEETWQKAKKRKKNFNLPESKLIIGTVARLHRQKGLIYFFQAARILLNQRQDICFVIAGGGPLEKKFRNYLQRKKLENFIFLLGETGKTQELYPLFDVFVLPSLWEGLPYALLEAAAFERPVIGTNIDGIRELLKPGETGLLVPPEDSLSLAEAILKWLNKPEMAEEMGRKLREDLSRRYSLERMVQETEELYLRLCREKGIY
ncbi:MAG: glycosyltransferase family 4 protein [Acidobacteriota bacterium]